MASGKNVKIVEERSPLLGIMTKRGNEFSGSLTQGNLEGRRFDGTISHASRREKRRMHL